MHKSRGGDKSGKQTKCAVAPTDSAKDVRRESEEWHRLIVNNCRDFAIFSADVNGYINSWNPGAERFFGYRADEICGKPMEILYTPEDRASGIAAQERAGALKNGSSEDERWHMRNDGSRFFVSGRVNPMYSDEGEHCGFIKIARDVTIRKELQSRLESSEELHRLILENIQDFAIFTVDTSGNIETWNAGAENTYGYSQSEIIGQSMAKLYVPVDRSRGEPEKILATALRNSCAHEEHWCQRKDGKRLFLTGVLRTIRDDSGSVRGFCKVARDITARRDLQDKLERAQVDLENLVAQRTASLSEAIHELETFSYSLSHDMRAPLRAMQGFAEVVLARHAANLPEESQDLLRRIASSAQRLDRLIKESLAYYRAPREPLPLEATPLEPVLDTLCSEHPDLGVRDTLTIERPLLPVMAHQPSLVQALTNLLGNAVRFVPPDRKPRVRLWTEPVNGHVRICLEDNGIGIAPPDQQKIWNLFTRLHPEQFEGTGIGLALVRKATERMGGTVGLESEPGKGSKFWVQLRAAPVEKSSP
jgi:PAS domain S-box-containing protein